MNSINLIGQIISIHPLGVAGNKPCLNFIISTRVPGNKRNVTVPIVAWGKVASSNSTKLSTGSKVAIQGYLNQHPNTKKLEIVATSIGWL